MEEKTIQFDNETLERYILANLIKDRSFFLKVGKYLTTKDFKKKSNFRDAKLQWIMNLSNVYYGKYDRIPSLDTVKIYIERNFKTEELLKKALLNCAEEIYNKDLSGFETDYLKDETISFIRKQRAVEATIMNQLDIQNGNLENLSQRMLDAVNINLDKDLGLSLADTSSVISLLKEVEEDSGLTNGTPALDRVLGTPKSGEITVFCGVPGIGKSIWLSTVAVENMKFGKKGVFFSLEVDAKRLAKRMYSSLLLKKGIDLINTPKEEIEKTFKSFEFGDVRIKNYPANNACCNDFAVYLNDLYALEGFKPDFICVDYILITAPNNKKIAEDNMYSKNKIVTEELRNLARQFNCPLYTAAQINRNGQSEKGSGTKAVVTSKDLAESRGILDTADYLLIINQTESEKKLGEVDGIAETRLFVDKNRNSKVGDMLTFTIDYNTMTITDGKKQKTT